MPSVSCWQGGVSLWGFAARNAVANPEWKVVARNRPAVACVMRAIAAEARLTPTRTLRAAPQKAPSPPISAAAVATAEPRFLASAAIAPVTSLQGHTL